MSSIQNILVAVDFTESDKIVLTYALQQAEKFGAKAWIVHIAAPDPDFVGYQVGPQYIRDYRAEDLKTEHKTLKTYADNFGNVGVSAEGLLIQGPRLETILDEATRLRIDLFVIGSHKHSFIYRLFNADTSIELTKKSKIPLLIVPAD